MSESSETLKALVVQLGEMSCDQLREMRHTVSEIEGPTATKEMVLSLIELYLSIGEDPRGRSEAAAQCIAAIDAIEEGNDPQHAMAKEKSGCFGVVALLGFVGLAAAGTWVVWC